MCIVTSFSAAAAMRNGVSEQLVEIAALINDTIVNNDFEGAKEHLIDFYCDLAKISSEDTSDIGNYESDCYFWSEKLAQLSSVAPDYACEAAIGSISVYTEKSYNLPEFVVYTGLKSVAQCVENLDDESELLNSAEYNLGVMRIVSMSLRMSAMTYENQYLFYDDAYKPLSDQWIRLAGKITKEELKDELAILQQWACEYPNHIAPIDDFIFCADKVLNQVRTHASVLRLVIG